MKTDTQLQKDVLAELQWEPSVNAAHIGVEVADGVVTLAGHVDSYAEKWDAERATQRVAGVKALAVEMDVKLSGDTQRSDTDIARAAQNILQWVTAGPKSAVKVMVENGWITLSGEVSWHYQKTAATHGVRYLLGVKGVSDQITIKPTHSAGSVKSDIEAALQRRAKADITVDVSGSNVTLGGKVLHWSERDGASDAAWRTSGVTSVVNNIVVAY
jgi:osmotically-inducible protein OsmY